MHIHTANSYSDLGICFTSTPMAPLFFLFREFINGMEMSLLVFLSHFIKRIKSYFSRGEGEKKKGEKKKKKYSRRMAASIARAIRSYETIVKLVENEREEREKNTYQNIKYHPLSMVISKTMGRGI